jgi:hypothetical protein
LPHFIHPNDLETVQANGGQCGFLFQRPTLPPLLSTSLEVGNVDVFQLRRWKHSEKAVELPHETPVGTTSLQVYQHLQKMNKKTHDVRQKLDWKRVNVVAKASQEEVDEVMMQTLAR